MFTRSIATALVGILLLVGACASRGVPEDALRLEESPLDMRAKQSRTLYAESEAQIVAATVDVLQDMEYNLDVIDPSLGVLTASKKIDADVGGFEKAMLISVDVICVVAGGAECGLYAGSPDNQLISLTMIVLPSLAQQGEFTVRVTAQYVETDKYERVSDRQMIQDEKIYQEIFANLNKSLLVEGER